MSVPTTNRVEDMLTNGEAEVVDSVVSHIPTSVAASEPCIPAVWKNSNKQTSASDSELAKQIMARPQVSHSPYVPGQLERHLEFMHFNAGKMINIFISYFHNLINGKSAFFVDADFAQIN